MAIWLELFQKAGDQIVIGGGNTPKEVVKANIDELNR